MCARVRVCACLPPSPPTPQPAPPSHLVEEDVLAVVPLRGEVLQHPVGGDAVLRADLLPELAPCCRGLCWRMRWEGREGLWLWGRHGGWEQPQPQGQGGAWMQRHVPIWFPHCPTCSVMISCGMVFVVDAVVAAVAPYWLLAVDGINVEGWCEASLGCCRSRASFLGSPVWVDGRGEGKKNESQQDRSGVNDPRGSRQQHGVPAAGPGLLACGRGRRTSQHTRRAERRRGSISEGSRLFWRRVRSEPSVCSYW